LGILYLVLGLIIGNQLAQHRTYRKKNENKTSNTNVEHQQARNRSGNPQSKKTFQVRKKIKKYLVINKDSPEPINPDQITVRIKKDKPERNKASPEPDSTVLALLWSHYKACSLGLLQEEQPAPWERLEQVNAEPENEQNQWIGFLKKLIRDKSWMKWIKNPEELKSRAIYAYQGS